MKSDRKPRDVALDVRVARDVMYREVCEDPGCRFCGKYSPHPLEWTNHMRLPKYSESMKDALSIINKLGSRKLHCILDTQCNGAMFFRDNELGHKPFDGLNTGGVWEIAPNLPTAICRAALRALGK